MLSVKSKSYALLYQRLPSLFFVILQGASYFSNAAFADTTISSTGTTVTTATANNGAPDNVIVSGNVTVPSGTAVTINSNNSLIANGTITSQAANGGIGVLFSGGSGITAALTNNSAISVTGTGGAGNIGILVTGGPITGSIQSTSTSSLSATGDNAIGLSILGNISGDIAVNNVTVSGLNSARPLTG